MIISEKNRMLVRVREVGKTRWLYMTPQLDTTGRRIRAAWFEPDKARQLAAEINANNAGEWEAEAVQ